MNLDRRGRDMSPRARLARIKVAKRRRREWRKAQAALLERLQGCPTCKRDSRKDSPRRSFHAWQEARTVKREWRPGRALHGYWPRWRCDTCKRLRNGKKKYPAKSHEEIVKILRQTARRLGKANDRFKTLKPKDVTKLILQLWSPT